MANPFDEFDHLTPASPIYGAPPKVEPFALEDQQFQRDNAARAAEDQAFQREKFEWEKKKADKVATDPKLIEGERTAAFLATRIAGGMQDLSGVLAADPEAAKPTLGATVAGWLGSDARGAVNSSARRQVEAAQLDVLDAALTLGTGAAYTKEQLEGYRQAYFPTLTDDPATIKGKQARLARLLEAAKLKAGGAAPKIDEALAALGGGQSVPKDTAEHVFDPGTTDRVELSDGGTTQRVDDPVLAGVNAKVNALIKSGAPMGEVAAYIKQAGVPIDADMTRQLREIAKFRQANPNYQGNYTVDIDDKLVPMSGMRSAIADAANSPLAAGAVAAADTLTGGHLDNIVGMGGGNAELANIGIGALREQNPIPSFVGDVAGGVGLYATGRGAMGLAGRGAAPATGTFAPRAIAGDAAMGGYIGSGADGTNAFSVPNALLGAVAGAGGGVLGRGAINTAGRALSPSGGALAPAYAEGVQPTIGQRMGGVFDRAEQAFASVPLVGGVQRSARNSSVEQWQAGAFNKALREIGTQLPSGVKSGTQAHAYMQRSFNQAYDKARSGLTWRQDPEFNKEFSELATNEVASLGSDGQRVFKSFVDRGANMLKARGGVLAGQDYKNLVSRIEGKVRGLRKNPSGDTELADALEGLAIILDKGARRHSTPEAVAAIDAADRGYVSAVLIEEASRKAGTDMGEFTGKQLESAIRSNSGRRSRKALRGEAPLQDYAAAGVRLGNNVPDSGTPERLMTMGALGGVAKFVDPIALTPWLANTLANLPGGKQAVNLLISPNRKALDPARRRLMERAHLGGLVLAAPAAEAAAE